MSVIDRIKRLLPGTIAQRMRRAGCAVGEGCQIVQMPPLGSEPWLIAIGRHVRIERDCTLVTHDGGTWVFRDQPEYAHVIYYGPIRILDNCHIGKRVTIMPGVTIGPNAIVEPGSIVTKDVPAGAVAQGNPARVVATIQEYAERYRSLSPSLAQGQGNQGDRPLSTGAEKGRGGEES